MNLVSDLVRRVAALSPLCHNMTNLVVQNFAANVATAVGASPIMSNNPQEAADLASLDGSLVINMGSATPESISNYETVIAAYNAANCPVLLDPVGCGATNARKTAVRQLMSSPGRFKVIKGNEAEITHLWNPSSGAQQKGVDSNAKSSTTDEKVQIVKAVAVREKTVVLMTGRRDYLSDGQRKF